MKKTKKKKKKKKKKMKKKASKKSNKLRNQQRRNRDDTQVPVDVLQGPLQVSHLGFSQMASEMAAPLAKPVSGSADDTDLQTASSHPLTHASSHALTHASSHALTHASSHACSPEDECFMVHLQTIVQMLGFMAHGETYGPDDYADFRRLFSHGISTLVSGQLPQRFRDHPRASATQKKAQGSTGRVTARPVEQLEPRSEARCVSGKLQWDEGPSASVCLFLAHANAHRLLYAEVQRHLNQQQQNPQSQKQQPQNRQPQNRQPHKQPRTRVQELVATFYATLAAETDPKATDFKATDFKATDFKATDL
jgi:hypothetical protein